jgi:hypothetical protein
MLVTAGCAMRLDVFPLVIVTMFSEHRVSDLAALFAGFEDLFRQDARYALILDTSILRAAPGAAEREFIANWCIAHREDTARCNVATSVLGANALVRGAITAVGWLAPFPGPLHHASGLAASLEFCVRRLQKADIALTPAARRFVERAQLFSSPVDRA